MPGWGLEWSSGRPVRFYQNPVEQPRLLKYADVFRSKALEFTIAKVVRCDGNVVGWVQGRMEFGPRALGGRSILGDPRNPDMQKKLNVKIKYRKFYFYINLTKVLIHLN